MQQRLEQAAGSMAVLLGGRCAKAETRDSETCALPKICILAGRKDS